MAETNDVVSMAIGQGGGNGAGLILNTWKTYHYNSNFLTPTDGWSFTVGDEELSDDLRIAIAPRQKVTFYINGQIQGVGIIDKVQIKTSRRGGTEVCIEGRDVFSPVVDTVLDPRLQFKESMTLRDVLRTIFSQFGYDDNHIIDYSDAGALAAGVLTGKSHGVHTTTKGKPIKSYIVHQLKPKAHEGAFQFAHRVSQRFGLWIWPSIQGDFVIVGTPDFNQEAQRRAIHKRGTAGQSNNVISATLDRNAGQQPSVIICSGFSTGGENPVDQFTVAVANPMIQTDLTPIWAAYPKTKPLDLSYLGPQFSGNGKDTGISNQTGLAIVDTSSRPLFLNDPDAKDIDQLTAFAKRELALRMHKAFTYRFEVEGHTYRDEHGNVLVWNVDTTVAVDDDISNIQNSLWIVDRTFIKDRQAGTRTVIEAILPHSLEF